MSKISQGFFPPFKPGSYPTLSGKVVLNTGAASGIGRAMSLAFARQGAKLMLLDINTEGLEKTKAQILEANPEAEVEIVIASITDDQQIEKAVEKTHTHFGRIDVLLNNAGISMNKPSLELTADQWRRAIDIDLSGIFYCSQSVAKKMKDQGGGVILSTASMLGTISAVNRVAYCSAKAGVVSMMKSLAVEWAQYGIRLNSICPGYILTEFVQALMDQGTLDAQLLESRTPAGRLGTPEEVAEMALFLASDAAVYVTGHAFLMDGGFTADGLGLQFR